MKFQVINEESSEKNLIGDIDDSNGLQTKPFTSASEWGRYRESKTKMI